MGIRKFKLVCINMFFFSFFAMTESFNPVSVFTFNENYGSEYTVETEVQKYITEMEAESGKSYIKVIDKSHINNINEIFKIDFFDIDYTKKRGSKVFFFREMKTVDKPCQLWEIDLKKNRVRFLLIGCADFAVSASGRYMLIFEEFGGGTEKYPVYFGTKFKIIDLEENKYVSKYNISKEIKKIYPNITKYDSVSVKTYYDKEKHKFYAQTRFSSYANGDEKLGEYIPIYLPEIYD